MPFDLGQVGDVIFRVPLRYDHARIGRLRHGRCSSCGLSGWILERRVRGVEVVA